MVAGITIKATGPADPLSYVSRRAPGEPPEYPAVLYRTACARLRLCRLRAGSADAYVDAVWQARDADQAERLHTVPCRPSAVA